MYHFDGVLNFEGLFIELRDLLVKQPSVNVGEWQSQHKDKLMMKELLHVSFDWQMPETKEQLGEVTGARLPWAEDHFLERVSGQPLNPAPSEAWWPFAKKTEGTNVEHKSEGEAFSHTYPERMWPRHAGPLTGNGPQLDQIDMSNMGIRFRYGDLMDVVNQLAKSPMTRQAYLPIWFPEDTGAVHGKRVPCTLGYHFIIRNGKLDISYFMRSTDLLRHFQDDVYLAVRLAQWMVERIWDVWYDRASGAPMGSLEVGKLIFHTANLHIFEQDTAMIDFWKTQGKTWF